MRGTITEAMKAAGIATDDARLYATACEAVRVADMNTKVAVRALARDAKGDPALLFALAEFYLNERVLPDMRGTATSSVRDGHKILGLYSKNAASHGPNEDGAGQGFRAQAGTQLPVSSSPVESGAGQIPPADAIISVPAPLSPPDDAEGLSGHAQAAPALPSASSPQLPDGAGQSATAKAMAAMPASVRKPNEPRRLDVMQRIQRDEHRALFDTYKVRGNVSIGDLTLGEARRIAATNEREAAVLRRVVDFVGYAEGGTPIRDLIKPDVLAGIIKTVEA